MRGEEYKCRVFKMHLKLKDQPLKTHVYRLLYKNFMVTTNQKPTIDMHTHTHTHTNNSAKYQQTKSNNIYYTP